VAQPFEGGCQVPSLTKINENKGEFWVENPWFFSTSGENLSCYERNGIHLNAGDLKFFDISYLSAADSEGDGRTVTSCDITGDGMPELFVRQAGGGPLLIFENNFPDRHWLRMTFSGSKSNRQGIGAKIVCEAGGKTFRREFFPVINFLSQGAPWLDLGIGAAEKIERLTILWPSGEKQVLENIPANQHIIIAEGKGWDQKNSNP
jgi:ASPIC and UnbV